MDAALANAAGALAAHAAAVGNFEDAYAAGLDQVREAVSSGAPVALLDHWGKLAGSLAGTR